VRKLSKKKAKRGNPAREKTKQQKEREKTRKKNDSLVRNPIKGKTRKEEKVRNNQPAPAPTALGQSA